MFEFAISQNKRRQPTQRIFISLLASCIAHSLFLLVLIEFPQLLRGGVYGRFGLAPLINILGPKSSHEEKSGRIVTILNNSPMSMPSAETLKKLIFDFNKKGSGPPPVRIGWGDVKAKLLENMPPMPRVQKGAKEPDLSLPANEPPSTASTGQSGDASSGSSPAGSGAGKTVALPPPAPAPKNEVAASNVAPTKIPDSIKPQSNPPPSPVKVFKDERQAITGQGTGFFDTKGFPLGEYASLIVEKIKGKWYIPSNLRNSQGHTTVIFYIDRDGRFTNARIVEGSGSSSLDLTALNAVIESNPFPPLPKGFPGDRVGAKFVFSYNEPQ